MRSTCFSSGMSSHNVKSVITVDGKPRGYDHQPSPAAAGEPSLASSAAFLLVQAGYACQLVFDFRLYRDRGLSAADVCGLVAVQLLCLLSGPWLTRALGARPPKRLLLSCLLLAAVSSLCKTWYPAATVAQALAASVAVALLDLKQRLATATLCQNYAIFVAWTLAALQTELLAIDARKVYLLAAFLYTAAALVVALRMRPGTCQASPALSARTSPTTLDTWIDSLVVYVESSARLCFDISCICVDTVSILAWATFPALADDPCTTVMSSLGMTFVFRLSMERAGRSVSELISVSETWTAMARQLGYCFALLSTARIPEPRSPFSVPLEKGPVCGCHIMLAFGVGLVSGPRPRQQAWKDAAAGLLSSVLLAWPGESEELQFESALAWGWPLLLVGVSASMTCSLLVARNGDAAPPAPNTWPPDDQGSRSWADQRSGALKHQL